MIRVSIISFLILFFITGNLSSINENTGKLIIRIYGFKSNEGMARVAVFSNKKAFPSNAENACCKYLSEIKNNSCTIELSDLPFGIYAVSVHHDENSDNEMNTNFFGIPTEGYGFSNNAKPFLGPPSFDASKFNFNKDSLVINIKIQS